MGYTKRHSMKYTVARADTERIQRICRVEGSTKARIISCNPEPAIPLENAKGSYGLIPGTVVSLAKIPFSHKVKNGELSSVAMPKAAVED